MRAASFCSFSKEFAWSKVQLSHTTDEYSRISLAYDIDIWFKAILLKVYLSFLITPNSTVYVRYIYSTANETRKLVTFKLFEYLIISILELLFTYQVNRYVMNVL